MQFARTLTVSSILLPTLALAPSLRAQNASQPANGLAMMTANQFRSAGLGKLSDDELQYLNRWLLTYTVAWMQTGARIAQEACQRKAEAALAQPVQPAHVASLEEQGVARGADTARSGDAAQAQREVVRANNQANAQAAQQSAENRRLLAQHGQYCALVQLDPEELSALLAPAAPAAIKQ